MDGFAIGWGHMIMIRLSTLIEHFEAPLLAQYGDRLRPEHHQALAALKTCRTALSPRLEAHCPACAERIFVSHSCGHQVCSPASTMRANSGWSGN
jgi:uncharacterized paraquat-inducible protein A